MAGHVPVVPMDRGNNTTCTINLHGATIVSWRVNNQAGFSIFVVPSHRGWGGSSAGAVWPGIKGLVNLVICKLEIASSAGSLACNHAGWSQTVWSMMGDPLPPLPLSPPYNRQH